MNKPDGFLKRWSRLKQNTADEKVDETKRDAAANAAKPEEEVVDPKTLPSIESLGPDSDYTVFLKKGVPEALRIAALRRAWVMDPIIRNFRTPADYDWDFTAPGYGDLRPSDDVEKLVNQLMGPPQPAEIVAADPNKAPDLAAEPSKALEPSTLPRTVASAPVAALPPTSRGVSAQSAQIKRPAEIPAPPQRRRHGGALPE